jgi:hypothetical protein
MRVYQVIMRSGAKIEVQANFMQDEPDNHNVIYFYRDEARSLLAASFVRDEVAGLIIGSDAGVTRQH